MTNRTYAPKRSSARWLEGAPRPVLACYDAGPNTGADRYTILYGAPLWTPEYGMRKARFIDALMAEHVRLAGCPDIVISRGDAYTFYHERCGLPAQGGFASADFLAFGRASTEAGRNDHESWAQEIMARIAHD